MQEEYFLQHTHTSTVSALLYQYIDHTKVINEQNRTNNLRNIISIARKLSGTHCFRALTLLTIR